MIIVLTHWRIKPTDSDVAAFNTWWTQTARVEDMESLVGEFLNAPLPEKGLPFPSNQILPRPGEPEFRGYLDVALWKNLSSFLADSAATGRNAGLQPFEAAPRTRTVLGPTEWRRGEWDLPHDSTC